MNGLFALLVSKLGGLLGRIFFFFFKSGHTWYAISFMCVHFWPCKPSNIGLILVLDGIVFHYIWLRYIFGTVTIYSRTCGRTNFLNMLPCINKVNEWMNEWMNSDISFQLCCLKIHQKKKMTLIFQYFGSVQKGQTNIFFLGLRMKDQYWEA